MRYTIGVMAAEDSKGESFDESVGVIAEKIRAGQESGGSLEKDRGGAQVRAFELERIRNELRESYGGSDDDDDDDVSEDLQPANLDDSGQEKINYLDGVEEKYKEPVAELVQSAVQGGISRAVARAQKKNDPYLVDAFHDSLAHLLHQKMQKQGLL